MAPVLEKVLGLFSWAIQMKITQAANIQVPENRQRKTFTQEHLDELSASFDRVGLLHPIVVRSVGRDLFLVAGERRLRTLIARGEAGKSTECGSLRISPGEVPYLELGELSHEKAMEAELEENIRRVDLSWQERATAEAALHAIRTRQAEERGERQTIRDTALETRGGTLDTLSGTVQQQVSQNLVLAKHLHDPEVAAAKTPKEALKVLQKKAEATKRVELAKAFDLEQAESPSVPHTLLVGDIREHLRSLPDGHFQVLLTDPPYGIDADSFGDQSGQGHSYADSHEYFTELLNLLADEGYRVCAEQAHAYIFCDPRRFDEIKILFELAGWSVWATPLIWAKNTGMLPRPEYGPRRTYETILFATKGDKRTNLVRPDVLVHPSVRGLVHGAQKPVSLYQDLLERSSAPGDSVLDPFAGSGTIFPAANRLKLRATGVELNPEYAACCTLRLQRSDDLAEGPEDSGAADAELDIQF